MKTLYVTVALFLLLLSLIAWNAVFVHRTVSDLEGALLSVSTEADMDAVWRLWQERRPWLCLSVPTGTVEGMEDRLTELDAALESKDADGILVAVRLSVCEARRLSFAERFCAENLF